MKGTKLQATVLAALAILAIGNGSATASSGKGKEDAELISTGLDDNAHGRVKFQVRSGSDGRFEVRVSRLAPDSAYEVLADGVVIGTVTTSGGGSGKLRFRSEPRSPSDLLLGFDPRGMVVVIRDVDGGDVLAITVPSTSSSSDDGDVICCIPDDSGPECEDRTPAECTAQGGTVSAATSCLPNPCAGTPPPTGNDVICCIPDDSGPECEDRAVDECSLQGGIAVEATSCLDNPCAGTPASDPDVRCCLPDDSGTECEDRTPARVPGRGRCEHRGRILLTEPVRGSDSARQRLRHRSCDLRATLVAFEGFGRWQRPCRRILPSRGDIGCQRDRVRLCRRRR